MYGQKYKKLLLIALLIVGCGGKGVTEPNTSSIVGVWTFVSKEVVIVWQGYTQSNNWILSDTNFGTFTFSSDGNYQLNMTYGGTMSTSTGTFSNSEYILILTEHGHSTSYIYSISENILAYIYSNYDEFGNGQTHTYVYKKSD